MRLLALLLLVPVAAVGCSSDPQEGYCEAVEDHQAALSEVAASDEPADIADDWADVVEPLHRLQRVLDEHGVDASSYAADAPPGDLGEKARAAIEAAAREVGSERTVTAMAAVEQHALDVCGTPLSR